MISYDFQGLETNQNSMCFGWILCTMIFCNISHLGKLVFVWFLSMEDLQHLMAIIIVAFLS